MVKLFESRYKYPGIMEVDKIKEIDMKDKVEVLKSKLNCRKKSLANTKWAVSVLRY